MQLAPDSASDPKVREAILTADRHFQNGKFFMQEGKPEDARGEFERAVEALLLGLPEDHPDFTLLSRKTEELGRLILRYEVERLGSGRPHESPVYVKSPLGELLDLTFPVDPRAKNQAISQVKALASQLPLTVNDAVASYITFFSTVERGRKTFLFGMKRAARYRPMIERILAEEGVPQELLHLAQAESGFMPMALSPKAAAGMWQFIRGRGNEYGLRQSQWHDDRLDPEKATRSAARHLRDLYEQLGDWYLAMAAYNCGPGCIERAVQRTGYADFWELRNRNVLPAETRNYVPAILAMAIIAKNPGLYGLELMPGDEPLHYDTIRLTSPTNLGLIADAADRPVSDIRDMNPSLVRNVAPGDYELRVPKGASGGILAALDMVPPEKRLSWRLHRIGAGDTLVSIAKRFAIAPKSIVAVNARLGETKVEDSPEGDVLIIPVAARPAPAVRASRTGARPATRTAGRKPASKVAQVRPAARRS